MSGNEIHSSSLYVSAATNSGVKEVGVYEVQDDSWIEQGEGGMTWNNKPAVGTEALASSLIDNAWSPRAFDVTGFTRTEFAGDQRISIALSQLGAGNYVGVKSRENTPADTIPYLQVVSYQLSEPEPQIQWPEHAVLQAEAISRSKVLLTWTPADAGKAPVGYSIYKKSVGESVYSQVYSATTADFAVYGSAYGYEVDGLLPGTYLFKVEAMKNDALETLTGPSVEITIPEHSFPPQLPSAKFEGSKLPSGSTGRSFTPASSCACNQAPGKIKQQRGMG
ncbi:DNRLRE domain-containing protein [Paenibacillus sp. GD4]|uniref:fibronectin type III domain-containing protein n=1 Tax=Paenibacillus sp. GD4 TaxID=3068890 RepID=UPI00279693EA|nr:fibronectin type III domain-containing protein [Paenibacillus sp. GD4]MDQ1911568.1 DNRLRE domain-containing protein [Paenibacillus sp. GD4]